MKAGANSRDAADIEVLDGPWLTAREQLRARGLRWTPQRRLLIQALAQTRGHVTGAELVERCRALDPQIVPSTVYRTLDVLEELGLLRHAHGLDGREEYHVLPGEPHGHLHCSSCGRSWELDETDAAELSAGLAARRRFAIDLSHLTVVGRCEDCASAS